MLQTQIYHKWYDRATEVHDGEEDFSLLGTGLLQRRLSRTEKDW